MEATLSQRRSEHARKAVVEGVGKARVLCESLPGLIRVNGLLAVALKCEQEIALKEYQAVYDALENWLTEATVDERCPIQWSADARRLPLAERLSQAGAQQYLMVTLESLEYMSWLKRWYQAKVEKPSAAAGSR